MDSDRIHYATSECTLGRSSPRTVPAAVATEARVARGHQQAHTLVGQHTLPHGETLLVLATHDLEHVALELLAQGLTINLSSDALVIESTKLGIIINLKLLLAPGSRVCDVQLHVSKPIVSLKRKYGMSQVTI